MKIFVFGSNLPGRHGKGAALGAKRKHGAIYGQGVGLQGRSYAIPTKDVKLAPLSLGEIKAHVEQFLQFAKDNPQHNFWVTPIGCGLAGYKPLDIAWMFRGASRNVELCQKFRELL